LVCIVDDIPIDLTEMPLNPDEIESVTMITDIVGKAMYGTVGANGIMYIKTKRGHMNERVMNVSVEDGVSVIDRFRNGYQELIMLRLTTWPGQTMD